LSSGAVLTGYGGVVLTAGELAWIRRQVDERQQRTRRELALAVCRRFGWRRPGGGYAVDSVRLLLVRWAKQGWLQLPAPQRGQPRPGAPAEAADEELRRGWSAEPGSHDGLLVRPVTSDERPRWRALMRRHHYLGDGGGIGETLRYVALQDGKPSALLCWAAAARFNGPRDAYLGWDAATRARRLHLVVNNVRFLVLPWAARPHLASQVLGANLRRLSRDWEEEYGHPVLLAETFVDVSRFRGTCYRASNWVSVGQTQGFTRCGPTYRPNGQPKAVFLYPLHPRMREWLVARESPADRRRGGEEGKMLDVKRLPLAGRGGLFELLGEVPEFRKRRGIRYRLQTLLAVAACAVLAGMKSLTAMADWAKGQSEETLRLLGCRRGKAPSEKTIRRVLGGLDIADLEGRVGGWFADQQRLAGDGVAIDGKTLRGSGDGKTSPVHLVSAVSHGQRTVLAQIPIPDKSNEINAACPLLEPLPLKGAVVTGDAMFTQKKIAAFIVEEKQGDYLFEVKDNQPTLRSDIEDLHLEVSPPGAPDERQGARPAGTAPDLDQHRDQRLR
jgi:hypothetical protein